MKVTFVISHMQFHFHLIINSMWFAENARILILDVVTQAGTYIKEMVHGEFGRTHPSISSIIDQEIDIVALDVNAIDLDWPKEIDNKASLDEVTEN